MPRRARLSTTSVVVAAVVVAVATFGLGFALSYDPGVTVELADEPTPTSTSEVPRSTVTTSPSSSTSLPGPVPTTLPPTTLAAVTTAPPTVVTTAPAPTTTPPTSTPAGPGRIEVTYPHDEGGRMLLVAGGAAAIIVRNTGGSEISFSVEGAGTVTVGATGVANGVLRPGEGRAIPVVAGTDPPPGPGPHATIAVFSSSGLIRTIPVVIA